MDRLTVRWRRMRHDDDGIALVSVVAGMMIASLFAFAALGYALNTQKSSKSNQDWNAALAAAQAGVDDYIGYLNRNDNYARTRGLHATPPSRARGRRPTPAAGPPAPHRAGSRSSPPSRPARRSTTTSTPRSSTARASSWSRSTGRAGTETRSLQVGVGRGGSTDFLYYTDHEDADPDNVAGLPERHGLALRSYWWQRTSGRPEQLGLQRDHLHRRRRARRSGAHERHAAHDARAAG